MPPSEIKTDPSDPSRTRVLSSMVKLQRILELQGKLRGTKLLEELIALESSALSYWDSDIVNRYKQRYSKEYFLRILYAEILLENELAQDKHLEEMKKLLQAKKMWAISDLQRTDRLEASKSKEIIDFRMF